LGLVGNITFKFSPLECKLRLYITLIRFKLEYASVLWYSITSTHANKLECIQQRFSALCFNRFFPEVHYCSSLASEELNLQTLIALFLTEVYFGFKFCPSVLEIVGLRVPARHVRDFGLFSVCSSSKNGPPVRCASAANVVCRDADVLTSRTLSSVIFYNILLLLLLLLIITIIIL
jgi:hypothetical protein